jgi:LysM repeat protein
MAVMRPLLPAVAGLAALAAVVAMACGGGTPETPGERITDPARVPSSTPIQNPTLFKIKGNEVQLVGGSSSGITPVAQSTPQATEYTIKSGDFCSTIATDNGITLEAFMAANRTLDCNALRIGDKVKIPAAASAATPTRPAITGNATVRPGTTGAKSYTVKSGDTCAGIASAHGVSTAALLAANTSIDANCTNLHEGQNVTIP